MFCRKLHADIAQSAYYKNTCDLDHNYILSNAAVCITVCKSFTSRIPLNKRTATNYALRDNYALALLTACKYL